jgi:hypothetical protein
VKPENYEFQSDFALRYFSLGKAEGLEQGKAELLIKLATLKFGSVPDLTQSKIRAATAAELEQMAEHVLHAATHRCDASRRLEQLVAHPARRDPEA